MNNPYPKIAINRALGIKGQGLRHNCWQEGYDAGEVETKELYEALKELINFLTHDGLDTNNRLLPFIDKSIKVLAKA